MGPSGQEQFIPETLASAVYMDEAGTQTLPEKLAELEGGVVGPPGPVGPVGPSGPVGPVGPPGADGHTPTLAEIGAAAAIHTHTPAAIGAAPASHTHTKANITDFAHSHATSDITNLIAVVRDALYPVGCIYMSVSATNPGSLFGGTWAAWGTGRVPVGVNTGDTNFNTVEKTGGANTHTLSSNEMPSHGHTQNSHNHGQDAHNHSQNAHSHTQDAHNHGGGTGGQSQSHAHALGSRVLDNGGMNVVDKQITSAGYFGTNTDAVSGWADRDHWHGIGAAQPGIYGTTATNNAATATNQAATATNNATGGGAAHNNLQPYITCYMWKRTA